MSSTGSHRFASSWLLGGLIALSACGPLGSDEGFASRETPAVASIAAALCYQLPYNYPNSPQYYYVTGYARYADGSPAAGARITASKWGYTTVGETTSAADGRYTIPLAQLGSTNYQPYVSFYLPYGGGTLLEMAALTPVEPGCPAYEWRKDFRYGTPAGYVTGRVTLNGNPAPAGSVVRYANQYESGQVNVDGAGNYRTPYLNIVPVTLTAQVAGQSQVRSFTVAVNANTQSFAFVTPEVCWDQVDNDGDGKTDCADDADCCGSGYCEGYVLREAGTNGPCDGGLWCTIDCGVGAPGEIHLGGGYCTSNMSNVVCRAAAGVCDVAEACGASQDLCPANQLKPAGTVCREARNACDRAEYCTGSSASCPPDIQKACPALD